MEAAEYAAMDAAEAEMWWYRALHARLLDALAGTQGRVLDAGCGTGGFLAVLRARRPDLEALGLEFDAAAARRAQAKSAVPIARGSINALPFAGGSFNAVISADVLCHRTVRPDEALRSIREVLRPNGRVVLNLPAFQWLYSAHDRQVHNANRFTRREVGRLLVTTGFQNARVRYWNGVLLPLMVVQRKILARGAQISDVAAFSPWANATLHGMTKLERHLPVALPAGGSVLAVAETA